MRALKPDCLPSSVSTAIAVQHRASYFTSTKFFLISPVCTNGAIIQIKSLDCCEYYKRAHVKSFPQCPVYAMCSVSVNNWQGLEAQMTSAVKDEPDVKGAGLQAGKSQKQHLGPRNVHWMLRWRLPECVLLACQRPTPGVWRIQHAGLWPPSPWALQVCSEPRYAHFLKVPLVTLIISWV